jgi:DNA-binding NarL/FixJ family response regulator
LGGVRESASFTNRQLTAREVEVLRLVAHGETDPSIAASLGISVKTVHTHVSHILDKLACTNRTAAAAVAIRHGVI